MQTNTRHARLAFLALAFTLAFGHAASAQSIVDARRLEFTPSSDHTTVGADGVPLVQSYSLDVFVAGSTQASQTVSLGKPAPASDGMIRLDFVSLLTTPLTPGVVYETRVSAVGPGGGSPSLPSNTFGFTAPCAPAISPASQSFAAAGGSGTVSVTAGAGCAWTAASNAAWLTVTAGGMGVANGAVSFAVVASTATTQRSGTLTVAGQTFTVTQAGVGCAFSISPTSQAFAASGGTGSVAVTTSAGCAWTATSSAAWVTVVTGSGTGSSTASFSVAANTTGSVRSGTLTVAGQTVTISQSAAECAYSLSAPSQAFTAAGGPGSVAVTTTSGCAWAVTGGASWVTVVNGASGTGGGTVSFSVAANTATTSRIATFLIAGTAFTITQSAPCIFFVSPLNLSPSAAGGAGTLTVTTQAGCAWSASTSTSWITVSGSGTGSGTAAYTIGANTTTASRTGAILAGGQSVPVTQAQPPAAAAPAAPTNVRVIGS
ncbi:MAG: hypothetical protein M3545_05830 [Acidobacteriota bacterium]|nr:hypothetical protein [Acidobacteriota bacterium]